MIPARLRSVVVLPAPFGPTRPSTSPARDVEREAAHGREVAVDFGEPLDVDHGSSIECTGQISHPLTPGACAFAEIVPAINFRIMPRMKTILPAAILLSGIRHSPPRRFASTRIW